MGHLAAKGFALGCDGFTAAALGDIGFGIGNFARGLAHIDFDFAESAGGRDRGLTKGDDVGADADDEVVHGVAHVVRGGGHLAPDAIEKLCDGV